MALISSGMRLTPARLNDLGTLGVRKTADQSVTNSTTLVNDSELSVTASANAVYAVEALLIYEATTANDIKIAMSWPSGTMPWGMLALVGGATTISGDLSPVAFANPISGSSSFQVGGGGAGNQLVCLVKGTLTAGAAGGFVRVLFAQFTAAAGTSAVMKAGSTLKLNRLS